MGREFLPRTVGAYLALFVAVTTFDHDGSADPHGRKQTLLPPYNEHLPSISCLCGGRDQPPSEVQSASPFSGFYNRLGHFVPPQLTFLDPHRTLHPQKENSALSAMEISAVKFTLDGLKILFNFYRSGWSRIGHLEKLEGDIVETEYFHRALVDDHLPDLPKDCEGIDREEIFDREKRIRS